MNKILVRGSSFFIDAYKKHNSYPTLQNDLSTEVLIVGRGITGALCAYYFAKQNIKVVLVEKGEIAACSTSISTSLLQYELDELIKDLEKNYDLSKIIRGYRFANKGLYEIHNIIAELNIDCDYIARDCLTYTNDPNKIDILKYEYEQRLANGFDTVFIDKNTSNYNFSFPIKAGVFSVNGGAEINPVKFTKELMNKAAQMGCEVYENTEIKDYKHDNNSVQVHTADNQTISCKKVIVTTGYDISTFSSKTYYTPYTSYNIVTSPISNITGWHNQCLVKTTENPYIYLRTTTDSRIIIGGEDTRFIPELLEDNVAGQKYPKLLKRLNEMFPQLDCQIEYSYNGIFGATDDNLPYIGPDPSNKNIWYCLGYGANGILFSVNGAKMLSNLYNGYLDDDLDLVAMNRN
ncbi:MAG: oxidoreductase [Anaerosolibacter sp.]|jgi:glycine/D-amino acid oxidase-like deaminating enzyme|uniref:NAD(P)/FAD-dependent oxidoreductase n=1 Tax=Anaerosolibacter sp. TaxID=1872527 RepID=UPI002636D128|nr:FAD-dependent oxidoreductase [Anaerosolibacter sp.]MDF2548856.1 oxidoreductase [Anaerosolibacter sp.]